MDESDIIELKLPPPRSKFINLKGLPLFIKKRTSSNKSVKTKEVKFEINDDDDLPVFVNTIKVEVTLEPS